MVALIAAVVLGGMPARAGHPGAVFLALPPEYVKRLLDEGDQPIFVDLRPGPDFARGRLPGARSVPLADLRKRVADVPRAGRVVLYCGCSHEEMAAAHQFLQEQGYRNISVLDEGVEGWRKRGYPLDR